MKLDSGNTYIAKHGDGYSVNIVMPDGSRNYLHNEPTDLTSAIVIREIIEDQCINYMNMLIREERGYYRLVAIMKFNEDVVEFHSRLLNLNDVVYERMQLLTEE